MIPAPAALASLVSPLAAGDPLSHVLKHEIFNFSGYSVTNHLVMLIVSALLLMIVIPIVARKQSLVPKGFRNALEAIMQYIREEVARPALGAATDRFMPLLWTFFFLILTANLLGMIPFGAIAGVVTQDAHFMHWVGGTATGNLAITAGLAIVAFISIHLSGMKTQGVGHYWNNFFFGHAPMALAPLMVPLEIIGALVKPFALAVRLFANMTAGHLVLAVVGGFAVLGIMAGGAMLGVSFAAIVGSVAISMLELFVAFLQAYIFTFLTTLFIAAAIHTEH
ncbi:MAG: F0F1 ATP synthase subunit A [Planctomycetes bacterium]|nr:F0F1 ATP synthase subunit A [Planctomycetota bacterium]MCB9829461.1 F0F1 ATP synthase subunit A [Planctomycetota bacterium]MCB9900161.1 F0F1 ATP synthase subunit A [Planctomycetota bacterium]